MANVITKLILEAEGTRETEKSIAVLVDAQDKLNKSIRDSAKGTDKASSETKELVDQYKSAIRAEKELRDAVNKTNDEFGQRRHVLEAEERFDRTSRGVGLAGDVESQARTVGGALGAFGFQGIESGISRAAEIPAVIEALPRLKEAALGLPSVLTEAAASLGPVGLVATVAFGAVLVAVNHFAEESQKRAEELISAAGAFRERTQQIAEGITSGEISSQLETLQRQRDAEKETLDRLNQVYDDNINNAGALGVATKILSFEEEALIEQIKESEKSVSDLGNQIEGWEGSLDNAQVAINDTIEAERELAQVRLTEASFAGELAELSARSSEFTREQIDSELRRIELQQIGLEAERESLLSLDEQTEETQQRIEDLNESLDKLGQKSEILENTEPVSKSETDLASTREDTTKVNREAIDAERAKADATREAEAQTRKLEQAQQKAQQAQQKYTQSVDNAGIAFVNAIDDIDQSLKDSLSDTGVDFREDLSDLTRDFNRGELKSARAHKRDLKKLDADSERAERDALRSRNFLALSESRNDAQDARDNASEQFQEEGDERLIEAQNQRTDIVTEAMRETRDLKLESNRQARDASIQRDRAISAAQDQLRIQEQTLRSSLDMFQQWGQSFLSIQQQALQSGSGTGTNGSDPFLQLTQQHRFGIAL